MSDHAAEVVTNEVVHGASKSSVDVGAAASENLGAGDHSPSPTEDVSSGESAAYELPPHPNFLQLKIQDLLCDPPRMLAANTRSPITFENENLQIHLLLQSILPLVVILREFVYILIYSYLP